MILKNLKLFSQNVQKNRLLTEITLENKKEFNIFFIQEPSWSFIWNIPSLSNEKDDIIVSISNYHAWMTFSRQLFYDNKYPRIITYINVWLI